MDTRSTFFLLVVVLVTALALAPRRGAASPGEQGVEHIPVWGAVSPEGTFAGHLEVVEFTVDDGDQVHVTGVLNGTATHRTGAKTQVVQHMFSAPATQLDADQTTDVLRLQIGPISLPPVGWQIMLVPVILDIYAVPSEGNALARLLDGK